MAADQCPNIHLDTSSSNSWVKYHPGLTLEDVFRQALAVVGPDRLLFGTDSSFFPRGWQRQIFELQKQTLDRARRARGRAGEDLLRATSSGCFREVAPLQPCQRPATADASPPLDAWSPSLVRHLIASRIHRRCRGPGRRHGARLAARRPCAPADLVLNNGRIVTLETPARGAGARRPRRPHRRRSAPTPRSSATSGQGTRGRSTCGAARDPGLHRGPRPLHRRRRGAAAAQPDEGDELGRDRRDGRGGGEEGASPGSGSTAAAGTRRSGRPRRRRTSKGFPTHDVARRGVAEQPGAPDARQRPRELRQRQGDGAVGRRRRHAESRRRRVPQGRDRQADRPAARDRVAADSRAAPASRRRRPQKRRRARRSVLELASAEVLSKGITTFQDAGSSFDDVDLMKQLIDEGQDRHPAVGDAARRQRGARREPRASTRRSTTATATSPSARSRSRSTARSARAARGCSSRTPTSPSDTGREHDAGRRRSRRPRGSRSSTAISCASTPSAIAPTARRSTSSRRRSRRTRRSKDLRWRVEHAQHLSAADIPRFGKLGVIASMQGIHCTSDAPYVLARLGAEARRGRRLRLAEADEVRRRRHQRHRRAGRGRRPDRQLLRDRQPQARRRHGVLPRSAHEPHRGAEVLHASTPPTPRSKRSRRAR